VPSLNYIHSYSPSRATCTPPAQLDELCSTAFTELFSEPEHGVTGTAIMGRLCPCLLMVPQQQITRAHCSVPTVVVGAFVAAEVPLNIDDTRDWCDERPNFSNNSDEHGCPVGDIASQCAARRS